MEQVPIYGFMKKQSIKQYTACFYLKGEIFNYISYNHTHTCWGIWVGKEFGSMYKQTKKVTASEEGTWRTQE